MPNRKKQKKNNSCQTNDDNDEINYAAHKYTRN